MTTANAAIQFHPDGYDTAAKLMGRQSAGESFLRGFLRHADVERFKLWNWGALPVEQIDPIVRRIHPADKPIDWIPRGGFEQIAATGVLYCASPANPMESWNRRLVGASRYSICGITHTTASAGIMDTVPNLILAPVEPWDALICTSTSVQSSLTTQLQAVSEYLEERLAPRKKPDIRLETIPLGINSDDFVRSPLHRQAWRRKLSIADDDVVVLYVGRFSFHGKMNHAPMALAMELAAQRTKTKIHWIWSGWASVDHLTQTLKADVARLAPSVTSHFLDGRDPAVRFPIWSAGDVFFSLSDNIQETFGLTPVEAMAAGLPSVISDWDGYKDTVRHELDGYRVPTFAPRPGLGLDFATQHANSWLPYERYIGGTSLLVAVDVELAAERLLQLFENEDLRRRMGRSALERAQRDFDWRAIVPRYQALWAELNAIRAKAPVVRQPTANPWRLDPYRLFASYPTQPLQPATLVRPMPGRTGEMAAAVLMEPTVAYSAAFLPSRDDILAVFALLQTRGPTPVGEIVAEFPPHRAGTIERGLLLLAKYNCVALSPTPNVVKG